MAITQEQVLHVARLARLDLSEDEVERLTRRARRDPRRRVEGVRARPRRRAADVASARPRQRAGPRTSRTSRCRSTRCSANAPSARGRHVPRAADRLMSAVVDTLRLTAEDALGLVERGERLARRAARRVPRGDRRARRRAPRVPAHRRGRATGRASRSRSRTSSRRKGVETTAGSRILSGYVPVFDATVAARCKAAGLTLLGKTNTDEFAMGSSTENSAFGPSRNPWDPSRVPGGSGGGTAAAVSAGLAPWGLGSDTGGSIKQPSALCGNVGLRPTYGTVSRYGDRRVRVEPRPGRARREDRARRRAPLPDHLRPRPGGLDHGRAARAGRAPDGGAARRAADRRSAPGGRARGDRAGRARVVRAPRSRSREELGAEVDECDLPLSFDYGMPCYYLIAPAEASSNLARYDGVRYGPRSEGETYRAMVERTRDEGFGDEPKRRIMLGTYALSAGYYDAYYGQAQKVRTLLVREHAAAFERFDVLATPTSPTVAFRGGGQGGRPARDVRVRPAHDPVVPRRPARAQRPVRPLRRAAGRAPADRAAVRREHALPGRPRARAGARRSTLVPERLPMSWEPVIGLEIHVQLKTRTKMFCRCPVGLRRRPRTRRPARSASASRARCPCRTGPRSSGSSSSASRSAARSRRARSSRARTTSTPICRRAIRFPSTICHLA